MSVSTKPTEKLHKWTQKSHEKAFANPLILSAPIPLISSSLHFFQLGSIISNHHNSSAKVSDPLLSIHCQNYNLLRPHTQEIKPMLKPPKFAYHHRHFTVTAMSAI